MSELESSDILKGGVALKAKTRGKGAARGRRPAPVGIVGAGSSDPLKDSAGAIETALAAREALRARLCRRQPQGAGC